MIEYIGEHLWVGQLGQFLIFLAFTTAVLAATSYSFGTNAKEAEQKANWKLLGRGAFLVHGASIILIIGLIFFMMINRYYEYDYVWSHVSNSLPFRYTFAAFWEGQEGSFLLWLFWHSILGFVLIKRGNEWEQPVMAVLSFAQIFFVFFILGLYFDGGDLNDTSNTFLGNIYGRSGFVWAVLTAGLAWAASRAAGQTRQILTGVAVLPTVVLLGLVFAGCYHLGEVRIGGSPFMLLRNVHFAPLFNTPNYLASIEGTGLNPLLQNYWMTIHPPTLFLGFATTIIPCAYAIAGLWTGEHKRWMEPALKWALLSAAILGIGIFMGGVWAYEALSFGGYWAWDPVENASLVPWITLVAGIHTTLVARATGYSTKSSYIFYMLTFLLIVYSTFLTRSGILGETSVHAFTEMGLEWQMVLFMGVLTVLGALFYYKSRKEIPAPAREESIYSREFWMFVGALVLLFSAGLITVTTSIPVINAIATIEPFETIIAWSSNATAGLKETNLVSVHQFFANLEGGKIAPPEDVVAHHNNFQLWIAILVALLSGVVQFVNYKKENMNGAYGKTFAIYVGSSLLLSIALTIPIMNATGIQAWQYWLLIGCALFAVFTNVWYIFGVAKGNLKLAGSALSHTGFGLMLVGVVFSGALKTALEDPFASANLSGILGDLNKQTNKNILVPYGQTINLSQDFSVSYTDRWTEGNAFYYELNFIRKDEKGNIVDRFITTPNVLHDTLPSGSLKFRTANPNTKHYWDRDVFTLAVPHWAFADPEAEAKLDTNVWQPVTISMGDTFYTQRYFVVYEDNDRVTYQHPDYEPEQGDMPLTGVLGIYDPTGNKVEEARVLYYIRGQREFSLPTELPDLGLELKMSNILVDEETKKGRIVFKVKEKAPLKDYVVVQALIFPGIQLVWIGCIMMMVGLFFSGVQRLRGKRQTVET
ncbi:MAG: cytochrome c biogenesis protein CcsA [Aureispira sp.]